MSAQGVEVASFVFSIIRQAREQLTQLWQAQKETVAGQQDFLLAATLGDAHDALVPSAGDIVAGTHRESRSAAKHPLGVDRPLPAMSTMGPPGAPWPPTSPIPDVMWARMQSESGNLRGQVVSLLAALNEIRQAGHNEHPTAIWMQQVAAAAVSSEKFNHPGPQPVLPASGDYSAVGAVVWVQGHWFDMPNNQRARIERVAPGGRLLKVTSLGDDTVRRVPLGALCGWELVEGTTVQFAFKGAITSRTGLPAAPVVVESSADDREIDENIDLMLAITPEGTIAGALPASQYQSHDVPYPDGWGELREAGVAFSMHEFIAASHTQAKNLLANYNPRDFAERYVAASRPVPLEIELADGGCIEAADDAGAIRRRDKDGNCEEIRRPGDADYEEWANILEEHGDQRSDAR